MKHCCQCQKEMTLSYKHARCFDCRRRNALHMRLRREAEKEGRAQAGETGWIWRGIWRPATRPRTVQR